MPWQSLETCFERVLTHAYSCLAGFFPDQADRSAESPRMNVHRGSDCDRLLLQEASCLMDETSAAAQEKETSSLTPSGLQNLAYPLTPRSDGMETRYWLHVEGFLTPEDPLPRRHNCS